MTIVALAIQLAVIVIFVFIASIFHWRCVKASLCARAVTTPLFTLYISMVLILIRCIYRLVEHMGNTAVHLSDLESLKALSPVLRFEWYFYVFEAMLMLVNSFLWNIWHPGRYMPSDSRVHLARDGITELDGAGKPEKTPILVTVGSMFTFGIIGVVHDKRRAKRSLGEEELDEYGSHRRLPSDLRSTS